MSVSWLLHRGLVPLDEYLPLVRSMGLDGATSFDSLEGLTLEEVDPYNDAGATKEQRRRIDAALREALKEELRRRQRMA